MIPANETPRHVEPFDWNDELDQREASWEFDTPEPFAFDPLAVAATEYVAAEVRVEPFWLALIVMICALVAAVGIVALVDLAS